nr:unnamed protein product [Spirometra erinaceieuropaei]
MAVTHTSITHIQDTTTGTIPPTSDSRGEDQDYTCRHCDRTFTSHIGLVSHLRIHRTETGEPVPGAPTYTHRTRLHCPHCPRTFTHRMGLFGHMRIHESRIDRPPNSPTTLNSIPTSSPITVIATDTDTTDFACPHCPRAFTSRPGLVGHLRIHRTETGEPVPGVPTYTHQAHLHCPHCPRTFMHRMDLLGHMRIHDDLRDVSVTFRYRNKRASLFPLKGILDGDSTFSQQVEYTLDESIFGTLAEAVEPD